MIYITIIIVITLCKVTAQQDDSFWKHVRFGGGAGLSFGTGFFSGSVAPSAIYEFNPQFAAGAGFNVAYANQKDFYESTYWGPSAITLFNPIDELQVSAEFEELNVIRHYNDDMYANENYWYPALYMGLGYRNQNVTFGIRYDVLYNEQKSIYAQAWMPFIRVYF